MEKKVTICGKEYNLKTSAYCILEYKRVFGNGLMADINSMSAISTKIQKIREDGEKDKKTEEEIQNEINRVALEQIDNLVQIPLQIAYIFIKSSNPKFITFDEWTMSIENISVEDEWIAEVTELAVNSFHR